MTAELRQTTVGYEDKGHKDASRLKAWNYSNVPNIPTDAVGAVMDAIRPSATRACGILIKERRSAGLKLMFIPCLAPLLPLLYDAGDDGGGGLTITISPVRELARSVTEEWPSASGGCPLGLLAGLLPLEIKHR